MSKPKQIRVLLLLLLLAPLCYLLFVEVDPRPDWERSLVVAVFPYNADGSAAAADTIAGLSGRDFLALEQFFAAQAARYGLALDYPFEFRLAEAVAASPPPPPPEQLGHWPRLRWAASLRWWHFRLDRQGLQPDIIMVLRFHAADNGIRRHHSIGMARPRLALVNLIADPELAAYNQVLMAHELLHTVGADDLYGAGGQGVSFPDGYAEPERAPRYPQRRGELMAMRIPLSPALARPIPALDQARIGQRSAREIGWPGAAGSAEPGQE